MFGASTQFIRRLATLIVLVAALAWAPMASALTAAMVTQGGLARGWDQVVHDRLISLGFTVTVIDHQSAAFTVAVAETYDLVYLSESAASSGAVGLAIMEAKVPVYLAEPLVWNDWHLTTAADVTQNNDGQTDITITGTSHPILTEAGLTGTVPIYNVASRQHTQPVANFVPAVQQLGMLPTDATRLGFWAVENGAALDGSFTAQERRACFTLTGLDTQVRTAADMHANGFLLFDAVVHWLVPASAPGGGGGGGVTTTTLTVANFSFQDPVIPDDGNADDEDPLDTDPGSPPGWNYEFLNGPPATLSYGVARPAVVHYGANAPAPAPFDADQYGFINLNNDPTSVGGASIARVTSDPVGSGTTLNAGSSYRVRFAVGGRNTGSWRDILYGLVLVDADNNELGTSATLIIDPGSVPNPNIQDLTYTLDVDTQAAAAAGKTFRVRLYVENTGANGTGPFTQANFDNVRVEEIGPGAPNKIEHWTLY